MIPPLSRKRISSHPVEAIPRYKDSPPARIQQTSKSDLDALMQLWNDGSVMGWVGFTHSLRYDREKIPDWFKKISAYNSARHFVVDLDGKICGEVFYRIDQPHRRAGSDMTLFPH